MIAIIDYGVGNLGSVLNAFHKLGFDAIITKNKEEILAADKIILPGVGAFAHAIDTFRKQGFEVILKECFEMKKPILGICVGMQMLFEYSNEFGRHKGLGYLKGEFVKFENLKVPQIGWNQLKPVKENKLLEGVEQEFVYFVHSYYLTGNDTDIISTASYGVAYGAAVQKDNIYAVQFHPEKSGEVGLQILKNFGNL